MIFPLIEEDRWLDVIGDRPGWVPPFKRTVVVAPHPDDETLGAGGLIAEQRRRGLPVVVIAVTDGDAAYTDVGELAIIRRREQELALGQLGVGRSSIERLGFPDARVAGQERQLSDILRRFITPETLVVAPWSGDWHPDHEACGRAAEKACRFAGSELMSYLFWTWHCKDTGSVASLRMHRFEMSEDLRWRKRAALKEHRSQLIHSAGEPILPENLLGPARRSFEAFVCP